MFPTLEMLLLDGLDNDCCQQNVVVFFAIVLSHSKDFGMLCWLIIIKEKLKLKSFLRPENLTIPFNSSFRKLT